MPQWNKPNKKIEEIMSDMAKQESAEDKARQKAIEDGRPYFIVESEDGTRSLHVDPNMIEDMISRGINPFEGDPEMERFGSDMEAIAAIDGIDRSTYHSLLFSDNSVNSKYLTTDLEEYDLCVDADSACDINALVQTVKQLEFVTDGRYRFGCHDAFTVPLSRYVTPFLMASDSGKVCLQRQELGKQKRFALVSGLLKSLGIKFHQQGNAAYLIKMDNYQVVSDAFVEAYENNARKCMSVSDYVDGLIDVDCVPPVDNIRKLYAKLAASGKENAAVVNAACSISKTYGVDIATACLTILDRVLPNGGEADEDEILSSLDILGSGVSFEFTPNDYDGDGDDDDDNVPYDAASSFARYLDGVADDDIEYPKPLLDEERSFAYGFFRRFFTYALNRNDDHMADGEQVVLTPDAIALVVGRYGKQLIQLMNLRSDDIAMPKKKKDKGVDTVVIGDIFGELFDALDRSFDDVDAAIMLMPLMTDEIYE